LRAAQPGNFIVRATERQMQKAQRVENRLGRLLEGVEQALQRGISRTTAVGMTAHAVNDDEKCSVISRSNGDSVLVVFAVTNETQVCILDPQALGSGRTAFQLLHFAALYTPSNPSR
jgi:hypothetical protein